MAFSLSQQTAAKQRNFGSVWVLQVTTDATAKGGLSVNSLLAALQETSKSRVEIIVPPQKTMGAEIQPVSVGGVLATAGQSFYTEGVG